MNGFFSCRLIAFFLVIHLVGACYRKPAFSPTDYLASSPDWSAERIRDKRIYVAQPFILFYTRTMNTKDKRANREWMNSGDSTRDQTVIDHSEYLIETFNQELGNYVESRSYSWHRFGVGDSALLDSVLKSYDRLDSIPGAIIDNPAIDRQGVLIVVHSVKGYEFINISLESDIILDNPSSFTMPPINYPSFQQNSHMVYSQANTGSEIVYMKADVIDLATNHNLLSLKLEENGGGAGGDICALILETFFKVLDYRPESRR